MTTPPIPPTAMQFEPLDHLERWWLRIGVVMIAAFLLVAAIDALGNAATNSHGAHTIAPEKVAVTAPFDKPGTFRNTDGSYDAVVVAYAFGFLPREDLVVPVGVPVHFKVASVDVVHGFLIPGHTNVNLEVLPGHVSEATQTFHEPGRYLILCHEYCGTGHHFMTAHIRVLAKGEHADELPASTTPTNAAAAADAMDQEHHSA